MTEHQPVNVASPYATTPRYRILVVDDEPSNIHMLNHVLKGEYDILPATSGEQALELCRRHLPDLVLLDVMMPVLDGYQVCSRLRQDALTRNIPVIFITTRDGIEDEERGFEAGGVDFITKPVSLPIVRARVRTHLTIKHQADLLRSMAFIDGLTGVANRRYFEEALQSEWRRCSRSAAPLAVIISDVDHFKLYNDSYGHQAGDLCLQAVARAMKEELRRPGDFLARYGGEEFICLLPETKLKGALALAEALGRAVQELGIRHQASAAGEVLTVSLGVAVMQPGEEYDPQQLVKLADAMLYQAKNSGRNCSRGSHGRLGQG
jgi:diguanylate cyclase (GGDEF)-like protein